MRELDHKEDWVPKNWHFQTLVLEKTLQSPLDCKEIKPVKTKGNQSWIFTGKTDADAEVSILWQPDAKSRLIGKDPDIGTDWRQEEKGVTVNEMVGWHHWFQWTWIWANSGRQWWTKKPGALKFMGLQRVGQDVVTEQLIQSPGANMRRQWHPIPVLLPGKSHGQRSLVGCSPWGR